MHTTSGYIKKKSMCLHFFGIHLKITPMNFCIHVIVKVVVFADRSDNLYSIPGPHMEEGESKFLKVVL